jgi:hypothetical protein
MTQSAGTTVLHVDAQAAPNGDGSAGAPLQDLGAAVTLANQLGGALILVAPGRYRVNATIRIEAPVSIIGSNVPKLDADGLPTGGVEAGTESKIVATTALGANELMIAGRMDGAVLHDVMIASLTLESVGDGPSHFLEVTKTQDFTIRNNNFVGPVAIALSTSGSSGHVRGNYISGAGCGACVMAGNPGSPAVVDVTGNRMVGNANGGLLLNGSGTEIDEFADELEATVAGNDLSDNTGPNHTGFGLRIFVILRGLTSVMNTQSTGHVSAVVTGNRIVHNQIGVLIDAGFPFRSVGTVCDSRTYSGSIDAAFDGNALSGSTVTPALITFTRNENTLTTTTAAQWQYLHNSTFTISDPDGALAGYWYDHPAADPFLGPCANDAVQEPLGNHLIYNGVEVLPGRSP